MKIDVSGLVCPQPVLVVRRCLRELEPGDELLVVGDSPPAERSIRRTCYKHGFAVSEAENPEEKPDSDDEGSFSLRIGVTESASIAADA